MPLVVFSHGIGGSRNGYSWLGRYFAHQGIASLHMQHVGSDVHLRSGNIFNIFGRLRNAAQESEAIARAKDLRFTLDTLLTSELGRHIDVNRIIAAGHSYGANPVAHGSNAKAASFNCVTTGSGRPSSFQLHHFMARRNRGRSCSR
ncbi:alpha/beta hydrolase family protein [Massilia cavernae]